MIGEDDYLWDRSGPVDPEVAGLERLLAGQRFAAHTPRRRKRDRPRQHWHWTSTRPMPWRPSPPAARGPDRPRLTAGAQTPASAWQIVLASAAVLALCAIGVRSWYQQRLQWEPGAPWQVLASAGDVRIDGRRQQAQSLAPENTLETGANATTRLRAAGIGEVAIGPGSRLRLVETRTGRHRVQLEQGRLWARVWAPPGQFGVGVAGAHVIDLGCEFLLEADADGNGSLSVLSGWVQVDNLRREVLVPEGAQVAIHGDGAAGTPFARSASPEFIAALTGIDARDGNVDPHGDEIARLLAASRREDAISLLVLLRDYPQLAEGPMFEHLANILPMTPAVTREAWQIDRMSVLDAWWEALPYPRVKRWWTQWPDALPSRSQEMTDWLQAQGDG